MSFAAISPLPAIRIAAMAIFVLASAKPAGIRNAVDSSGAAPPSHFELRRTRRRWRSPQ